MARTLNKIPAIAVSQFIKEQLVRSGYSEEMIQVLHLPAPETLEYTPLPEADLPRY